MNYKHLKYFYEVFTLGSIARASKTLRVTPQTISGQLTLLEDAFGVKLFQHKGRHLELTEAGEFVLERANTIFQEGGELEESIQQFSEQDRLKPFRVGVSDLVPKSIVYKLLEPAVKLSPPVCIICTEGKLNNLLEKLNATRNRMDVVIADSPMPVEMHGNGVDHPLGSSSTSFFVTRELGKKLTGSFPQMLDHAPMLIPAEGSAVRRKLREWFSQKKVKPRIVGEFDDSALMREFGQAGAGIFIAPTALREVIALNPEIECIGQAEEVRVEFFAISAAKRLEHPAVTAITKHAQDWLQKD